MKIISDIDDVVTETMSSAVNLYNKLYGDLQRFEDLTEWDLTRVLPELKTKEAVQNFFKTYSLAGKHAKVGAVYRAVPSIRELQGQGHEVLFVSARASSGIGDTYRWFARHGLPIDNLYFDKDKGWQARYHEPDIFIDDGIHNLVEVKIASPTTATVLFDRPWNRNNGGEKHAIDYVARDWRGVMDIITGIQRGRRIERGETSMPAQHSRWTGTRIDDRQYLPADFLPEVFRDE